MAHQSNATIRPTPASLSETTGETFRILVVDDESMTMTTVGHMLEALGARVDLANGGAEAQRLARRHRYALVLTDYQMPGLNGYALAVWIKQRWQNTLVFVMTGCNPAEVSDYAGGNSVDRWIYKPFGLAHLREALVGTGLLPA
jgi:two-component system capsular synthesis sensor histidine kinase RcsC